MNIVITGHKGFLGSALTRHLISRGHFVFGTDRQFKPKYLTNLPPTIDYIIHCADVSPKDPNTFERNIELTHALLLLRQRFEMRKAHIIYPSSLLACDATKTTFGTDLLYSSGPVPQYTAAYGMAKRYSMDLLESTYPTDDCTILMLGNVFGPGDKSDRVIPSFIRQALANGVVSPKTSGNEKRTFLYIDDVVRHVEHIIDGDGDDTLYLDAVRWVGSAANNFSIASVLDIIMRATGARIYRPDLLLQSQDRIIIGHPLQENTPINDAILRTILAQAAAQ